MELIKGGHLKDQRVSTIIQEIARGMQWLHEHEIIHRDLKLTNKMIYRSLYPQIIDFGMSSMVKDGPHIVSGGSIYAIY